MRQIREKKDFEKEFWIVQNTINENPIKINRLNSFLVSDPSLVFVKHLISIFF